MLLPGWMIHVLHLLEIVSDSNQPAHFHLHLQIEGARLALPDHSHALLALGAPKLLDTDASPHVQGTRVVSASGTIDAVVAAARIVLERIYGA